MPLFKVQDRIVHFIHIPKTGGTSIEKWFGERFPSMYMNGKLEGIDATLQHMDKRQYPLLISGWADFEFTIVRDPIYRMISAYRWRYARAAQEGRYVPSFKIWLIFKLRAAERNPRIDDNFYVPQSEFVGEETIVFKFEDGLDHALKSLKRELPICDDRPLPHFYKSQKLPVDIDQECLDLIKRSYDNDFYLFDYDADRKLKESEGLHFSDHIKISSLFVKELRQGILSGVAGYLMRRIPYLSRRK